MNTKKKKLTNKQFEDCLVQTIAAYAMLADVKSKKKKPRMSAQGFILMIASGRTQEAFDICTEFKTAAASFISENATDSEREKLKRGEGG